MHDADFRTSEKDWHGFVEQLTEKLVDLDDSVPELPVKDIVSICRHYPSDFSTCLTIAHLQIFRIYRDIRFSSDPTPYKVRAASVYGALSSKFLPARRCFVANDAPPVTRLTSPLHGKLHVSSITAHYRTETCWQVPHRQEGSVCSLLPEDITG